MGTNKPINEVSVDPYSTHMPVLAACMETVQGKVVECGAGLYSTPLLLAMSRFMGVKLISWEEDKQWAEELTKRFRGLHKVKHSLDIAGELKKMTQVPDIVFFDNGAFRICPLRVRGEGMRLMFARGARLVIAHDTEPVEKRRQAYGYDKAFACAKYRVDWPGVYGGDYNASPWTSVLSNVDDLSWLRVALGVK